MAKYSYMILIASFVFSSMNCYALKTPSESSNLNVTQIQQLTGHTGQFNADEKVLALTIPRDDLTIQMSGMPFTGAKGLSSTIAFKKIDGQTTVNGELILLQDQVNPVLTVALANGLQVTALNNPFLWDSPRVMMMHIKGEGDASQLPSAVAKILAKINSTTEGRGDFPMGNMYPTTTTLNGHRIDLLLGAKGRLKNDVYEVQFNSGAKTDKTIAVNTWAAFAGSDNEAIVNGALSVHQSELQPALLALRKAQFYILAIYQHPLNDDPTLVTVNFWAVGPTATLAKALRTSFMVAQNGSKTPTETMLGESFAMNAAKAAGEIPLSPSLVQNNYCSYANALRTSSSTVEKEQVQQSVPAVPLILTKTPVKALVMPAHVVAEVKPTSQLSLPSANKIMSQLYIVENNLLKIISFYTPHIRLSEVNIKSVASSQLSKIDSGEKLSVAPTKLVPVIKNDKHVKRVSLLSAREMLSSMAVFKNNRFI